ncbi:Protein kinase-like domain protein [Fusarium austroafricanum]|uniref:Protein kinase-like domain protein n=1 Tax=Fusarium austroafricanum TaxID=2364996 RepID=A0A8H4NQD7_9HYPO|nr:Protein kinase-like domain protein [Fusarium austroafricanum]
MDSALSPRQLAESFAVDDLIEIIHAQPKRNSRGHSITGFGYPLDNPVIYIKYGDHYERATDAEARTHKWAYETLQKMPQSERQGIHIPEVYRVIDLTSWTIIIMEFISGKTLKALLESQTTSDEYLDQCFGQIERALRLFISFPVPQDASPGPYGGGLIKSPLFKYYQATIEYPTVELLEMHLNKIATWFNKEGPKLNLERKLHFVLSDLYEGNFMFTESGDLFVIDFEMANFLPLSFMTYAMIQHHDVCSLKDRFELPQENLEIMRRVSDLLIKSVRRLGLPVG